MNSLEELDALNTVMIDHLTNDMHIYDQVCLNVRDIQELKLIRLPSTFHESKAKLRAIDPCLVDIRLSPSDELERKSNDSSPPPPIARRSRGESLGSNGGSALISSSSKESIDEQINKFSRISMNNNNNLPVKPATLLAKKILPKKIERNNHYDSNQSNTQQKKPTIDHRRKASPIRVTITSKLNPDATPFYVQQRSSVPNQNSSFTFYDRTCFQPRLQPVISPDHSQSHVQQTNHHRSHQRFVPPRQMANKKNFTPPNSSRTNTRSNRTQGPPLMKYRLQQTSSLDKRVYPQQQHNNRITPNGQLPGNSDLIHSFNRHCFTLGFMRQTSLPMANQMVPVRPMQPEFPTTRNNPTRRSTASIRSTYSLPFQVAGSNDRSQMQTPVSLVESASSHRGPRTFSGASSSSSLSLDVRPHSINQFDSSSNNQSSFEAQYDFEKANEEFRRYLELEELVARCPSTTDGNAVQQSPSQSQANSYKKGVSFFDRISCTATTGTAVGYTEMDETEKNLQTFGDDALLLPPSSSDDEWQF